MKKEVLKLYGERVDVGTVVTEEMLLAIKYLVKEVLAYRELRARPDIVRHELGLCAPHDDGSRFM